MQRVLDLGPALFAITLTYCLCELFLVGSGWWISQEPWLQRWSMSECQFNFPQSANKRLFGGQKKPQNQRKQKKQENRVKMRSRRTAILYLQPDGNDKLPLFCGSDRLWYRCCWCGPCIKGGASIQEWNCCQARNSGDDKGGGRASRKGQKRCEPLLASEVWQRNTWKPWKTFKINDL